MFAGEKTMVNKPKNAAAGLTPTTIIRNYAVTEESIPCLINATGQGDCGTNAAPPPPAARATSLAVVRAGSVLRDLAGNVVHNQLRGDAERSRFEGRATNVRVRRVARKAFEKYLEGRGMAFLEDVDAWLSAHEAKSPGEKTDRLGVGVYLIVDDEEGP